MVRETQELAQIRVGLEEVLCHFQELEDPREPINIKHSLESVVVIAIMGILAGAAGPTSIAEWAKSKSVFLIDLLSLGHGVPRKDVFRRVLTALKPEAFQTCFNHWIQALCQRAEQNVPPGTLAERPLLPVDGKTARRSHDRARGLGALHSVSVYAAQLGITLAQVATMEKSNEITAIPEALKLVNLAGAIVTIDAMGTQTEIAEQVVDGEGDYLLALKGNHPTLYQTVMEHVNAQLDTDIPTAQRLVTTETGHGRKEQRIYMQFSAPETLPGFGQWKGFKTIGVAMLTCLRDGQETYDTRYYISSLELDIQQMARAVRSHWAIENSCHWTLDMTYREDESRTRGVYMRENLAWLYRFTLSLLKQCQNKKSVAMNRRRCGWNEATMLEILTGITT